MDTNDLIKNIKHRYAHHESKLLLQEKYTAQLSISLQGGMWNITPQLLSFLATLPDQQAVILDSYNKPVLVNRQELYDDLLEQYRQVMNQWHQEYTQLSKLR